MQRGAHATASICTSIARRAGQSGLSLGVADFVVSEPNRNTMFYDPVSEEGKTGRDLAAAKFVNKLKFGAEGATFGVGFALAGKALPIGAKYGLYKPGAFALGFGAKAVDTVVKPVANLVYALYKTDMLKTSWSCGSHAEKYIQDLEMDATEGNLACSTGVLFYSLTDHPNSEKIGRCQPRTDRAGIDRPGTRENRRGRSIQGSHCCRSPTQNPLG